MGPGGQLFSLRGVQVLFHSDEVFQGGLLQTTLGGVQFFLVGEDGCVRCGVADGDREVSSQLPDLLAELHPFGFKRGLQRIKESMLGGGDFEVLMHPFMKRQLGGNHNGCIGRGLCRKGW